MDQNIVKRNELLAQKVKETRELLVAKFDAK